MTTGDDGKRDNKPNMDAPKVEIGLVHTNFDGMVPRDSGVELKKGDVFAGRYAVEGKIGEGGLGSVYRAKDQISKKTVALKLLRSERLADEAARHSLIAEAVTARDIRHPNIVAVYDAAEDKETGAVFITMEHLVGESLRTWLRRMVLEGHDCSYTVAASIMHAILDGLEAAHGMGVIHRDLKPENVFLIADPAKGKVQLKLLDFGVALAVGAQTSSSGAVGTHLYMAPEQQTAPEAAKAPADFFALSKMFYEMLVGVVPDGPWDVPSQSRKDLPEGVDQLIQSGLAKHWRSRPQSVAEYRKALVDVAAKAKANAASVTAEAHKLFNGGAGDPAGFPKARALYLRAAEDGDVLDAGQRLGWMCYRGLGGPKDVAAAYRWFQAGADAGDAHALSNLAWLFFSGDGVEKDEAKGAEMTRRAAEGGDSQAMVNIYWMLLNGRGVETDHTAARAWMLRAAEKGSINGMTDYAEALRVGRGGPEDVAGAREWYRKAAERGGAVAMINYGVMLEDGVAGEKDLAAARQWFQKAQAAGQKNAPAALARVDAEIARLAKEKPAKEGAQSAPQPASTPVQVAAELEAAEDYEFVNTPVELKRAQALEQKARELLKAQKGAAWREPWDEAHELYKQLVGTGNPAAKIAYARFLDEGAGSAWPARYDVAKLWYESAAEKGSAEAKYWLGRMYYFGRGMPADRRKANELFEQAGDGGYLQGYGALGLNLLGNVAGDVADHPRAREIFGRGAKQNDINCMGQLAIMLAEGKGGPKDPKASKEWFLKAKALDDSGQVALTMKRYFP